MPVSKHRKKGKSSRQWRKDRNIRREQNRAAMKTDRIGFERAMRVAREELANKL
jgi:hypothetical protein